MSTQNKALKKALEIAENDYQSLLWEIEDEHAIKMGLMEKEDIEK